MSTACWDFTHDTGNPLDMLTPREKAVMVLYAQGLSIKEIANDLCISVKTAETHRNNFGRKLGYPNRSQITAMALEHEPLAGSGADPYS